MTTIKKASFIWDTGQTNDNGPIFKTLEGSIVINTETGKIISYVLPPGTDAEDANFFLFNILLNPNTQVEIKD